MIWKSVINKRLAQAADVFTVISGYALAYWIWILIWNYYSDSASDDPPFQVGGRYLLQLIFISFIYVIIFGKYKAYSYQRFTSLAGEYLRVLKTNLISILAAILFTFLMKDSTVPRLFYVVSFIVVFLLLILEKTVIFFIAKLIRKKEGNRHKVIVIGTGERTQNLLDTVNTNFDWGLDIVGILTEDEDKIGKEYKGVRVIDTYLNLVEVLKRINPAEVIITLSTKKFDKIRSILEICEDEGVHVKLNSDFFGKVTKQVNVDRIYGLNFVSFHMISDDELALTIKRGLDLIGAILALIIFSPFMIFAALGILISNGRPVFYRWNVIGFNKNPFYSWKFRTMVKDADEIKDSLLERNEMTGPVFKIKDDPRIFPFGRFLRKWSIDETPQLFSVLKGDMSLVGPRPAGANEIIRYESWHRRKLSVKPGITCLWQAGGRNRINKFDEWVKLDLEYIDKWSLILDFKILLRTIPAVISRRGAR